jgi:hypothetical protein
MERLSMSEGWLVSSRRTAGSGSIVLTVIAGVRESNEPASRRPDCPRINETSPFSAGFLREPAKACRLAEPVAQAINLAPSSPGRDVAMRRLRALFYLSLSPVAARSAWNRIADDAIVCSDRHMRTFSMKTIATLLAAAALALAAQSADAKGCLKGAAVGGAAGHFAGHHGVLGAAAGCLYGHHRANEQQKQQERQQQSQSGR